jgi:hypothetical protein
VLRLAWLRPAEGDARNGRGLRCVRICGCADAWDRVLGEVVPPRCFCRLHRGVDRTWCGEAAVGHALAHAAPADLSAAERRLTSVDRFHHVEQGDPFRRTSQTKASTSAGQRLQQSRAREGLSRSSDRHRLRVRATSIPPRGTRSARGRCISPRWRASPSSSTSRRSCRRPRGTPRCLTTRGHPASSTPSRTRRARHLRAGVGT